MKYIFQSLTHKVITINYLVPIEIYWVRYYVVHTHKHLILEMMLGKTR